MTTATIFTAAHKLAATYEGNYSACFALALRTVYNTPWAGVTVGDVRNYISSLNTNRRDLIDLTSAGNVADMISREVADCLTAGTLAHTIFTTAANFSDKQLWVLAYELIKSPKFTRIVFDYVTRDRLDREQEAAQKAAKMAANKQASEEVLAPIRAARKLGAFEAWIKKSQYKKEFWSGKITAASVNAFLSL